MEGRPAVDMFVILDLVHDVLIDFSARRSRILLFLMAVALSTGTLVAAVGIATMAARQVDADIAASATNVLTVRVSDQTEDSPVSDESGERANGRVFTANSLQRVEEIETVQAAGLRIPVANTPSVSRTTAPKSGIAHSVDGREGIEVIGATSGYLEIYDVGAPADWMLDRNEPYAVAVVGKLVAEELGIPVGIDDYSGYRLAVDGSPYEVIAVAGEGPIAGRTVVVPYNVAVASWGDDRAATLLVRTEPGAGRPVSRVVREALIPERPELLQVSTAVDLSTVRTGVKTQLTRLATTVGVLLLILTALLIANSMVVAVVARTSEIGLRRALGASRGAIAMLFLADGGLTGLLGGLGGSALSSAAVVGVAVINNWSVYLELWYLLAGPVIGLVVGIGASAYPSWRAARISPAEAVRVE